MCCLQQFVEYNLMSWQQVGTLGVLMGCFWLATLIIHLVPILEDSFVDKRWPVGTLSPLLFNLLIYIPPYVQIFQEVSTFWFNTIPPVILKSSCFSLYSMVCSSLHSPYQYNSLILVTLSQTHNFILYFPFPGRKIYYIQSFTLHIIYMALSFVSLIIELAFNIHI